MKWNISFIGRKNLVKIFFWSPLCHVKIFTEIILLWKTSHRYRRNGKKYKVHSSKWKGRSSLRKSNLWRLNKDKPKRPVIRYLNRCLSGKDYYKKNPIIFFGQPLTVHWCPTVEPPSCVSQVHTLFTVFLQSCTKSVATWVSHPFHGDFCTDI